MNDPNPRKNDRTPNHSDLRSDQSLPVISILEPYVRRRRISTNHVKAESVYQAAQGVATLLHTRNLVLPADLQGLSF